MEYRIIRSSRKTISIEITLQGKLLVRAPKRMASRDIHRFVEHKQDWITAHFARIPNATPLTQEEHEQLIRTAKEYFPNKVSHFAEKIGVTHGRITIRSQHTRWGSCSAAGNLSFNCLLMLAPEDVRDYIIIHELCHRKEMNHSPRFWAEVEKNRPDYHCQRAWLKEQGATLMARLPVKKDAQK